MDNTKQNMPSDNDDTLLASTPENKEPYSAEQFGIDLININSIIESMLTSESTDPAVLWQAWNDRADITERYVNSLVETSENSKVRQIAQFDTMLDKAEVYKRVGNIPKYLDELECIEDFALNSYLDDYVDIASITKILDGDTDSDSGETLT